ncbi:MAG: hypothetical protein WDM78_10310 [Puia sp.]
MSPLLLFSFVVAYFVLLLVVAYRTSRGSNNESFFIGNRNSNWMLVAFGMIGTSLSGVTFVSVPGAVARDSFSYFQITLGYFLGYILIAYVLLPLYYRLHLTSIYNYLNERLGMSSYKTGAAFFYSFKGIGRYRKTLPGGKYFTGRYSFGISCSLLAHHTDHSADDLIVYL